MCTTKKHYPPVSKRTLTWMLTSTLTIWHTDTDIQRKKSTFFQNHQNSNHWKQWHTSTQRKKPTFFQNHQNSDHWRQWHTDTQRKKPTFFQDHQDSNHLRTQELRSSEVQHRSSSQDKNTADSQKQKKLSFRTHLFIMMIETLVWHNSVDKFSPNLVYMTNTSSVSNSVFFRKKGRKCRNCRGCICSKRTCTCSRRTCTCTCTCTHTGDSWITTTHSKNKKVNKELWETSQCI